MNCLQVSIIIINAVLTLMPKGATSIDYFPHYPSYEHSNFFPDGLHGFYGQNFFNRFQEVHNRFLPSFDEFDTPNGIILGDSNPYIGFGENRFDRLENFAELPQIRGVNFNGQLGGVQSGLDTLRRLGGLAAIGGLSRLGALAGLAGLTGMRINPLIVVHLGRRKKHGRRKSLMGLLG